MSCRIFQFSYRLPKMESESCDKSHLFQTIGPLSSAGPERSNQIKRTRDVAEDAFLLVLRALNVEFVIFF